MPELPVIRIDIVSDIMCPWCIIGYKKLEQAMRAMKDAAEFEIVWQPFELNPDMPFEGEHLGEHLRHKYGSTKEQSIKSRQHIIETGKALGFEFCFNENSRIFNSFLAHQLLHWAKSYDKQTVLKLALFDLYFTQQQNPSVLQILLDVAEKVGLDRNTAKEILETQCYAQAVRDDQSFWMKNDVRAVPAFIFNKKYLLSGAQEPQILKDVIETIIKEQTQ
ncbi:MAG: putative DsbA family dithiol-disulfide isomerase [Psychromonas sp.]|jgi:predicted DsbA family dithiol-disulfide isomerase|uniref:DsbA family oxidoreductase n=1 Tax=Psychromonas sp. TaxID=1884585 RepID=UPI0039E45ECD